MTHKPITQHSLQGTRECKLIKKRPSLKHDGLYQIIYTMYLNQPQAFTLEIKINLLSVQNFFLRTIPLGLGTIHFVVFPL